MKENGWKEMFLTAKRLGVNDNRLTSLVNEEFGFFNLHQNSNAYD